VGSNRIAVVTPLAAALLGLLAPIAAHAGEEPASPPGGSEPAAPDVERALSATGLPPLDSPYDRSRAFWLSFAPTLGGIALGVGFAGIGIAAGAELPMFGLGAGVAVLAIAVGPSLGHLYVRNYKQVAWCLTLRAIFAIATPFFVWGTAVSGAVVSADEGNNPGASAREDAFLALAAVSLFAAGTLAIVDIATAPRAARRANEKALEKRESEQKISAAAVAPFVAPGQDGATTAGLAFSMRF
jgi:hypothetical protein